LLLLMLLLLLLLFQFLVDDFNYSIIT
jgi:hypothetical protein